MARHDLDIGLVERLLEQLRGGAADSVSTSARTRSGSASMSMPTMRVSGRQTRAPTTSPACVPALPEQWTMARGVKPSARALLGDLGHGRGIGHRAQRIGDAVGHDIGLAALGAASLSARSRMAPLRSPFHGTSCRVAPNRRLSSALPVLAVLGRGRRQPAVIDGEMAVEPELAAAAAATWRWLFDCTTPPDTSVSDAAQQSPRCST